jgi:hypothetical protein
MSKRAEFLMMLMMFPFAAFLVGILSWIARFDEVVK